jgi:hypothetical protein
MAAQVPEIMDTSSYYAPTLYSEGKKTLPEISVHEAVTQFTKLFRYIGYDIAFNFSTAWSIASGECTP